MKRRDFIKKSATATTAILGFPAILSAKNKYPTIKVLGTHVTLQEQIRLRAQKELKINIEFFPGGSAEVLTKAIADPSSFDLYEQWSNSTRLLWNSGSIQAIDTKKLTYWNEINSLAKTGKITPSSTTAPGDSPNKILYIQNDKTLGSTPSEQISFMPYVHNVDSFGYNSNIIKQGTPYESESWGWLLDKKYNGKVAIVNEPSIGLFDLILATKAQGLVDYKDIGNLTIKEIDALFDVLFEYKKENHFRGFWNSVPHSIERIKNN